MAYYKGRVSTETKEERFNKKYIINDVTDCWEWTAALNNIGYGMFRWASNKMRSAHRVSYELFNGPIPDGMAVCHKCDNPKCVNPKHLWVGTLKQNAQDMVAKGRSGRGMFGYKHKFGTCEHCGAIRPVNTLARNHNDKCKDKP
jgi:hypothetical protein